MIANVPVRQDILTSWQRCVVAGLRPDHFEVPYQPDPGSTASSSFRESADPGLLPARDWLSLTDTEREVANLAAQGLSSQAAAERMRLPRSAVPAHLRQVFRKLGVRSRPPPPS